MWERENHVSCRKPRFGGWRLWKQVKVMQIPMPKAKFVSQNIWLRGNDFDVKTVNCWSRRPEVNCFLIKFNRLLFTFFIVSYRNFFPLFVCFNKLWQLATPHARVNTRVREARNSFQNDVTRFVFFLFVFLFAFCFCFFAGERSRALAL